MQYTQTEAERAAGMTREKHPPAHPVGGNTLSAGLVGAVGEMSAGGLAGQADVDQEDPDL